MYYRRILAVDVDIDIEAAPTPIHTHAERGGDERY